MYILNEENCNKKVDELQNFKGFLPFQFDCMVNLVERKKFLQKHNLWEDVRQQDLNVMAGMRNAVDVDLYMDKVLTKWLADNPSFKDCVLEV